MKTLYCPDLNPRFQQALYLMEKSKKSLFITGKAGTGKSTLLSYFCARAPHPPVMLAPTGVSALNINGLTIHRFFKFNVGITPEKVKKLRRPKHPEIYKKLKTIVIDEISMVRADLLDCVDSFLQRYGPEKNRIFGGVQMIFVGDLYQLPPVVGAKEKEMFGAHYETPFFFSSKAFEELEFEIVELEKVYRQKDPQFIKLLNRIRNNSVNSEDIKLLNLRHFPEFNPPKDDFYIYLTSINKTADQINQEKLKELKGPSQSVKAHIEGDFGPEYFPTAIDLQFKVGAQIMLLNNDSERRWVNGSLGAISSFDKETECLYVELHTEKKEVEVYPHKWEIFRFSYSKEKKAILSQLAGVFIQFPFRLAWAITVHKSQGKTFDRVIVDMSRGMFACGQAYVALSRCTSFKGLVFKTPVKKNYIKTDYRIFKFLTQHQYTKAEKEMPLKDKIQFIEQSIVKQQRIKISYLKANDIKSERTVLPIEVGMQSYRGKQYRGMRAFCFLAKEERMFRLDRILKMNTEEFKNNTPKKGFVP